MNKAQSTLSEFVLFCWIATQAKSNDLEVGVVRRTAVSNMLKKTAINLVFRIFDKKLSKMDLQTRKIKFVQEFLKLQSEEAITKLEDLLKKEKKTDIDEHFKPMTENELNERIDQSESDFKNNRYKRTSELLAKYE